MEVKNQSTAQKKILVIRYRFIGDTILTVPFLRNLRQYYPDAEIDILVGPQSGEVLKECPYIDELIEYDTTRFHKYDQGKGAIKSFWYYVGFIKKRRYDTVFVLKRSLSSGLLAYLSGAKERIGYGGGFKSLFLTTNVPWDKNIHEVDSTLTILTAAKIPVKDNHLEAWTTASEIASARILLPQGHKKYILIHAAAAHPDKMYPSASWSQIINSLNINHGFTAVLSGAKGDSVLNQEIIDASEVDCINLAGKLSLRESMALYKLMQFAICVDSGPSHLSAAMGTPTLTLFGPTDPVRWRPFGTQHKALYDTSLSCRPCNYNKICDDKRECLTGLTPETVLKEALALYNQNKFASFEKA